MSAIWLPMWQCSSTSFALLAARLELVHHAHELGHVQAELRVRARRLGPTARAARREPHAHAELRHVARAEREALEVVELGVLLDHGHDVLAELLPRDHQRQHRAILDAVADEQRVAVDLRQARDELRLRAALETHAVRPARVEQLVDDLVQLVHLDRIDAAVDVAVVGLGDRAAERLVDAPHLRAQHVLEAQQHRELHAAAAQLVHDVDDVDRRAGLVERAHGHVAVRVHEEERVAPARDPVELGGVLDRPLGGRGLLLGLRRHLEFSPEAGLIRPST